MNSSTHSDNVLVQLDNLSIGFDGQHAGDIQWRTHGVSLSVRRGQRLGVVGESGSGKSITARSIMRLVTTDDSAFIEGTLSLDNQSLTEMSTEDLMKLRGARIGLIMQEPMSALHPTRRCGEQIKEVLDIHDIGDVNSRKSTVLELLRRVQLAEGARIYDSYPYQLSRGEQQRVCIAMAIAAGPELLICDEPTTALDSDTEEEIVALIRSLSEEMGMAVIFISHDIHLVMELCSDVIVMRDGQVVESGESSTIAAAARHPYTRALLRCQPTADGKEMLLPTVEKVVSGQYRPTPKPKYVPSDQPLLTISDLHKSYTDRNAQKRKTVLKGVNLQVNVSEIVGIMGPSGSGKSTLAQCIAGMITHDSGSIVIDGTQISSDTYRNDSDLRQSVQMIFQDPMSSLNPRQQILPTISEAVQLGDHTLSSKASREHAMTLLKEVGLSADHATRYPATLSGGERQRVCIARALALRPKLLICDECVSALDVSVQAKVLNLLTELRAEHGLTILFISHDRDVVDYLCDRVLEMQEGSLRDAIK